MTTLPLLFLLVLCPVLVPAAKVTHRFSFINLRTSIREENSSDVTRGDLPVSPSTDIPPTPSTTDQNPLDVPPTRKRIAIRVKATLHDGSGESVESKGRWKEFNLTNIRVSLSDDEEVEGSGEYEYEYVYEDELEEWAKKKELEKEEEEKKDDSKGKKEKGEEEEYEEVYEYVYEDEIETTTETPFVFREAVIEMDEEEASGFTDDFTLPEQKSKIVITEISQIDTRLFERELMSMRVRDEQVSHIRDLLHNASYLELDTGESHKDHGGSYVLPLLQAVGYDNNTVPLIFSDIPVHVRTQLKILYLGNFDSHLMEFTVDAEMNMRWFDLRLANNFTRPIRLREKDLIDLIWRPDPYFVNSKYSYFHHVTFPNFRMIITPQGLVSYTMRITLLPSCPMIFCRYPHDRQECDLRMSSIAYPRSLVRFTWHSTPFIFQTAPDLPELTLSDPWADECSVEGKLIASSCLRLVFNLKREEGRYIVEKYLPSALAMMFSWVAPYVPYHYEEVRIVTPITVLLTLVQMEKGDEQVRTSYLTSMDFWFAVMKEKQCEKAANEYERMMLIGKRQTMRRLVTRVDRFSQIFSPLIFISFLLYYVLVLSRGDEKDCVDE
ncbi:hypothetical protein PMAYCL1PPCAC_17617 [Pristionchus mayeri]|uniref:Neurotransmitter-gated ion-channel ligand-binding domain-containing protein n=1 Tax=Pristionchus mayeri TaxID=1317129 RepID=A0AAN5CN55_9BILA|nr:hypothetical protein PMAYCL1PPCAC_17617 [Pristionchus mayeri]